MLLDQAQRLAAVGSWELDMATGALSVSDELVRQTGLSASEVGRLGLEGALAHVIHPDDADVVRSALARAVRGEPLDLQVRFVRPDGEIPGEEARHTAASLRQLMHEERIGGRVRCTAG